MLLIDELENRTDSVRLVEGTELIEAQFTDEGFFLLLDGGMYRITNEAFDVLLNMIRIPIKYIKRCAENGATFLAEQSINYWLSKFGDISFLVRPVDGELTITQVFPGERLYIPGVKVNDLIFDYLGDAQIKNYYVNEDVFGAVYISNTSLTLLDETFYYGIRVLYSDCFKITPRFDGVLCSEKGAILAYQAEGRKFRVAGSTIPQVFEQIEELLDLSMDGLNGELIPKLKTLSEDHPHNVAVEKFISGMCSELRLSRKIKQEMLDWFDHISMPLVEIVLILGERTATLVDSDIDVEMARDIQIAISSYIMKGSFK